MIMSWYAARIFILTDSNAHQTEFFKRNKGGGVSGKSRMNGISNHLWSVQCGVVRDSVFPWYRAASMRNLFPTFRRQRIFEILGTDYLAMRLHIPEEVSWMYINMEEVRSLSILLAYASQHCFLISWKSARVAINDTFINCELVWSVVWEKH